MARRATKKTEASDEALSAVEEALKIDFGQEADADAADDPYAGTDSVAAQTPVRETRQVVAPSSPPANDDRRAGTARFAAALARKPSSAVWWFAVALSALWVLGAYWAGYRTIGDNLFNLSAWTSISENPNLIYFAGTVFLPLLVIWGYAFMIRRAQELKLAARSMTEVAYRLIEPETEAADSIRSVSQAVRVEVGALTDGIERAMARAGELESLVHTEVSSLENSYSDNELRMRGLIEELASERESIVNHTERVRSSISGATETLQEDLNLSAQQISSNVAQAQLAFSQALGNTNEEMKSSLDSAGSGLLEALTVKGQEIGEKIEVAGGSIVGKLDETREKTDSVFENIAASLSFVVRIWLSPSPIEATN